MSIRGLRITASVAAAAVVAGVVAIIAPMSSAAAAVCASAWQPTSVYHGGMIASHGGHNWSARWWTQNEVPGNAYVWADRGTCDGGGPD
ncbi:carbohydrate-binding protein, partial [Spongiactinospora gelatinilytica]